MARTIELYNALRDKLGEAETKLLIDTIEESSSKTTAGLATKEDLAETKADILKWMFIFWATQIGLVVALIKLLGK